MVLALVGFSQTVIARGKALDDDMTCAVVLKRAPKESKDHLGHASGNRGGQESQL